MLRVPLARENEEGVVSADGVVGGVGGPGVAAFDEGGELAVGDGGCVEAGFEIGRGPGSRRRGRRSRLCGLWSL